MCAYLLYSQCNGEIAYVAEQCVAKTVRAFCAQKNTVIGKSTKTNYENIRFNKVNLGYLEMAETF